MEQVRDAEEDDSGQEPHPPDYERLRRAVRHMGVPDLPAGRDQPERRQRERPTYLAGELLVEQPQRPGRPGLEPERPGARVVG